MFPLLSQVMKASTFSAQDCSFTLWINESGSCQQRYHIHNSFELYHEDLNIGNADQRADEETGANESICRWKARRKGQWRGCMEMTSYICVCMHICLCGYVYTQRCVLTLVCVRICMYACIILMMQSMCVYMCSWVVCVQMLMWMCIWMGYRVYMCLSFVLSMYVSFYMHGAIKYVHKLTCMFVGIHSCVCAWICWCIYVHIFIYEWARSACILCLSLWVCSACVIFCVSIQDQYVLMPKLVKWFTRKTVEAKLNRKLQLEGSQPALAQKPRGSTTGWELKSSFLTAGLLIWHLTLMLYSRKEEK